MQVPTRLTLTLSTLVLGYRCQGYTGAMSIIQAPYYTRFLPTIGNPRVLLVYYIQLSFNRIFHPTTVPSIACWLTLLCSSAPSLGSRPLRMQVFFSLRSAYPLFRLQGRGYVLQYLGWELPQVQHVHLLHVKRPCVCDPFRTGPVMILLLFCGRVRAPSLRPASMDHKLDSPAPHRAQDKSSTTLSICHLVYSHPGSRDLLLPRRFLSHCNPCSIRRSML